MRRKRLIIIAVIAGVAILTCLYFTNCCRTESKPSINSTSQDICDKNCQSLNDTTMQDENALSCKLTSPELQKRKSTIIADIKSRQLDKKELSNGFAFRYEGSDEMIDLLTEFVKSERQCCDFFNFAIRIEKDNVLWLDITGPKGAKEFIKTELEM